MPVTANNGGGGDDDDDDAWPNHPGHNVALRLRSPIPSRVSLLPKTRWLLERMKLLFSCPFISFPKDSLPKSCIRNVHASQRRASVYCVGGLSDFVEL